jgi:hypothetical protein
MSPTEQSPCKTCEKSPCKEPKTCEARWEYVKQLGGSGLQAVDAEENYRLVLP